MTRLKPLLLTLLVVVAATTVVVLFILSFVPRISPNADVRLQLQRIQVACEQYYTQFGAYPDSTGGNAAFLSTVRCENTKRPDGTYAVAPFYHPKHSETAINTRGEPFLIDVLWSKEILYFRATGNPSPTVVFGTSANALFVEVDNPGTPSTATSPHLWRTFNTTSNAIPPGWTRPDRTHGLLIATGPDGIHFTADDIIHSW